MLQGIGIVPMQLLGLGTILSTYFFRLFCKTPRGMLLAIWVLALAHRVLSFRLRRAQRSTRAQSWCHLSPSFIDFCHRIDLVSSLSARTFTKSSSISCFSSIVKPLILPFTAIYFGFSYLVYKYRLLNVYHRPFESRGQAWPIAFNRIAMGLLIFQLFMTGIFTVKEAFPLSTCMALIMAGSAWECWRMHRKFRQLSRFVNLQQACEAARDDEGPEDVQKLRRGHPVTESQTRLSQGRYNQRDDGLYVVADDPKVSFRLFVFLG